MDSTVTTLDNLIKNSKELSSLPEIYIRVSEILDDEHSTSNQIGAIVHSDPALTARILKVVNSSFYGFPNEISTISQAINILGRNPLRQLLMGTVLGGVFSRLSNDVFLMDEFWQHSVHTAVIAKNCYLNIVGKVKCDELFVAGLLHKIGRLVIAHQMPEAASKIQKALDTSDTDIVSFEQELLGFSHNEVAAAIMRKWGLPTILRSCALHQFEPSLAGPYKSPAWIIHIASSLAQMPISNDDQVVTELLDSLTGWEDSGLNKQQFIDAYQDSFEQFQEVLDSLGL